MRCALSLNIHMSINVKNMPSQHRKMYSLNIYYEYVLHLLIYKYMKRNFLKRKGVVFYKQVKYSMFRFIF